MDSSPPAELLSSAKSVSKNPAVQALRRYARQAHPDRPREELSLILEEEIRSDLRPMPPPLEFL